MSIRHLHDDLLFYLAKYLSAKDCLSLAISGVNERFCVLYGTNRERLVMTECYYLRAKPLKRFFSQYMNPSTIIVCDVSHCYWLRARTLTKCIIQMPNLEELYIHDTKMTLKKMPKIFEACQKIVKLSLTLKEDNLKQFQESVFGKKPMKWMKKGFAKITHLKLFTFVVPYAEKWRAAIGVLKWCRNCFDLLISVTSKDITDCSSQTEYEHSDSSSDEEKEELFIWRKLESDFKRITKITNLVVLSTFSEKYVTDDFTKDFVLYWLLNTKSLERLWVTPYVMDDSATSEDGYNIYDMRSPIVKSGMLEPFDSFGGDQLEEGRFLPLEHLANVHFDELENGLEHLLDLKYVSGYCQYDGEGLNDLCERHPKLEQLHFQLDEGHLFGFGDWQLLLLKVLVYECPNPSQRVMDHLTEACPNIEQLHIKFEDSLSRHETVNFLSSIRFQKLNFLTISGDSLFDGSHWLSMVENCPKLERLHLKGAIKGSTFFFLYLAKCFPSAPNLRDLRIQWKILTPARRLKQIIAPLQPSPKPKIPEKYVQTMGKWNISLHGRTTQPKPTPPPPLKELEVPRFFAHLPPFFGALKKCPNLERVVLYAEEDHSWNRSPLQYVEDTILPFVNGAPHLVALCLAGLPMNPSVVEQQLMDQIAPIRKAFWFHVGPELPKQSDMSVPRIHQDGIVYPTDPYNAPPQF